MDDHGTEDISQMADLLDLGLGLALGGLPLASIEDWDDAHLPPQPVQAPDALLPYLLAIAQPDDLEHVQDTLAEARGLVVMDSVLEDRIARVVACVSQEGPTSLLGLLDVDSVEDDGWLEATRTWDRRMVLMLIARGAEDEVAFARTYPVLDLRKRALA